MRFTVPFLTTRIETDLALTLGLTPVWWILGFNIFIYHFVVVATFIKLIMIKTQSGKPIILPAPALWLGLFCLLHLASIIMNIHNHPMQRIIASLNNYVIYIAGFLLAIIVCNCDSDRMRGSLTGLAPALCAVTGLIACYCLFLWLTGHRSLEIPSVLGQLMPSLLDFPYFSALLILRFTTSEWLLADLPRVSIYSIVHTASGGFMLMIIPLMQAYFAQRSRSRIFYGIIFALSLVPLIFSLSRSAMAAFLIASAVVYVVDKRQHWKYSLSLLLASLVSSKWIYDFIYWLTRVRGSSTDVRMRIYQESVKIAIEENIFFGIGVKLREGFSMISTGSHSTYVGLLLVTGVVGLSAFLIFQIACFFVWFRGRNLITDEADRHWWKALGTAFMSTSLWLFTDSVDALPFIAYTYFLIIACLLALDRKTRASGAMESNRRSKVTI